MVMRFLPTYRSLVICLKYNIVILFMDLLILGLLFTLHRSDLLSVIMFAQSGALLTVGGLVDLSSSAFFYKMSEHLFRSKVGDFEDEYERSHGKADACVLLGCLIFAETLLVDVILGYIR